MLVSLAIRNVVLIDRLDLACAPGLSVLTGETGAGKSILLDSLGLALGARADAALLRQDAPQASVTAVFEPPAGHSAFALAAEQGLEIEEGTLVLRRLLGKDGRSRAFVNDQPVSVTLLRALGDSLVEVQGQFESRGLLDGGTHRSLLDAHGGLEAAAAEVAELWRSWRESLAARQAEEEQLAQARREESYLRHALGELEALDPEPDEEERLAEERSLLLNAEKLAEAVAMAGRALANGEEGGARGALATAERLLERVADKAGARLDPALAALSRATAELAETEALLSSLAADLDFEPGRLETIEERFFALKDLARKHNCQVGELASLKAAFAQSLAGLDAGEERLAALAAAGEEARARYIAAAQSLFEARRKAARKLDSAVKRELAPLKLEKARFVTEVEPLKEEDWGPAGLERVGFLVATNPGAPAAPIGRIASGGELARFLLALKVVLAGASPVPTLVFDEVDSGIGGATAAAVGERLARLAESRQVLVVTHSPQVAARGEQHWQVSKEAVKGQALTRVRALARTERREEVARMLSGAEISEEARAAAGKLLGEA